MIMDTMRHDLGPFVDPLCQFTSFDADMDGSFVSDGSSDRRSSVFSASTPATMSFASTHSDGTASSSMPTTPITDIHRFDGQRYANQQASADVLMTPESPVPSWKLYGRHSGLPGMQPLPPPQKYLEMAHNMTRNMMDGGFTGFHAPMQHAHHAMSRDMPFTALDPIQTQFSHAPMKREQHPAQYFQPEDLSASSMSTCSSRMSEPGHINGTWQELHEPFVFKEPACAERSPVTRARRSRVRSSRGNESVLRGKYECKHAGCDNKRFQRKEHLRRHYMSKHTERKFECLQGRVLGARFCNKLLGLKPISRSDNVNQHSCTHVINGMGKTRNSLCEYKVAEACIMFEAKNQSEREKAAKQCAALFDNITKNVADSADKGIRTAKPRANVHISHDIMAILGFDVSRGCPHGPLHVFEGGHGPLCMAFTGTPEPQGAIIPQLDGDISLPSQSKPRRCQAGR